MNKQDLLQKLNGTMGTLLIRLGIKRIQDAFKIEPAIIDGNILLDKIRSKSELTANQISRLDRKYYLTDWETWKKIIDLDWTDTKDYIKEKFDCDDFSRIFQARIIETYGLNSCMTAYGKIYNKETGAFINYHYWIVILTSDDKLMVYEPGNDKYTEYSNETIIGNWKYVHLHLR